MWGVEAGEWKASTGSFGKSDNVEEVLSACYVTADRIVTGHPSGALGVWALAQDAKQSEDPTAQPLGTQHKSFNHQLIIN